MLQSSTVNAPETIHQNMIVDEEMKTGTKSVPGLSLPFIDEDMFPYPNTTWAKNDYGE